jgi:hypothetical protein
MRLQLITCFVVEFFRSRAVLACVFSCSALAIIAYGGMSSWGTNQSTQLSQMSRGRKGSRQAAPHLAFSALNGEEGEETTCDCSQVAHCYMCFKPSEGENEHKDKPHEVKTSYTLYLRGPSLFGFYLLVQRFQESALKIIGIL